MGEGKMEMYPYRWGSTKKTQHHQIIQAFGLTALKFNDILKIYVFEIQSDDEWWFDESKVEHCAKS